MSTVSDTLRLDPRRISWSRLLGDHDRIAQQCAALVALVQRDDEATETASILLLELAVFVADHLGVEDEVIDLTLAALRTGTPPRSAVAMTVALDALKRDWTTFLVTWTPAAVAADWPAFAVAAQAMLPRLAAQVRHENELLYAEALRRGIIDRGEPILH
ncbi:hypothetical protein M9979_07975 [Sphingomonas sp. RP10(2022)]|uniref:Hemerythrin-like domain-containing protein n=1 Tax=Sphingomonas liriopis TaxID=2949094 RepID=A0A9X2HPA4_9SPHN|nr:hypothetical protein [Sphingomonas liriopis]MCP3734806.1 hypothetical protein [Sphingomonas liriopis]